MVDDLERYWLAGLLEGEGSFIKGPPSSPRCPIVRLPMTDQDVVERAARLFCKGVGHWDRKAERPRKRVYITSIKGAAAAWLMAILYPVMSSRRRAQIDRALSAHHPERIRAVISGAICSVTACPRRVRSRGLCLQHYRSWWKSVRHGRTPKYRPIGAELPPTLMGEPLVIAPPEDPRSWAWLAGLLEGEATFSPNCGYPLISVHMCDIDVLERAAPLHRRALSEGRPTLRGTWVDAFIRDRGRGRSRRQDDAATAPDDGTPPSSSDRPGARGLSPDPTHGSALNLQGRGVLQRPPLPRSLPQALHELVTRCRARRATEVRPRR